MNGRSTKERGPGKNKRLWSPVEDEKLIEAMLDLHLSRTGRADNGFKAGYFQVVEKMLACTLPNSGLKVDPHIRSRLKSLKSNFYTVYDMIHGPNSSGFGCNDQKQCIVADNVVWEEYLKSHNKAAQFKDKAFPYFTQLLTIFGKDRASGKHAEGFGEADDAIREEEGTQSEFVVDLNNSSDDVDEINASVSGGGSPVIGNSYEGSVKQKKRKKSDGNEMLILDVINKSSKRLCKEISAANERLSIAIEDATIQELKTKINGELKKLVGLTMFDRHKATIKIGCDRDLTVQFFNIDDEEKEEWVKALLTIN